MTAKISFGQWLKQRRKALDLTREDLAIRIGCAANTIYKIEADERRPSKQIAALLAEHLNIVPAERAAFVNFARTEVAESTAPWGTTFHPPTNLPAQPTLLIGRDEDVAAIRKRLLQPESRLLTLLGPPGIGKTRLALQVADQTLDDFADGVFFVSLATITDANLVSTTIASTLGLPDAGPQTPLERLKAFLHDKQTLLLLDNFEQILTAAPQIAELLAVCPSLKVLVTSRAPLRIRQERQMPVSPLALPDLAHLPNADNLTHYAAVTLFIERAQAVQPDFSLTDENAPTVAAICTRLDGLPLAIELISARVKLLSPAALLERLHGRLLLQSNGLRDIEPRHRTLKAAIDWSYQLLSAEEQTLFWRLGVFVGGWTLEAAEAVCMENLNLNIMDGLASLLDKNLVKHDTSLDGEPRFTMLETIREFALERLVTSEEMKTIQRQHLDYFVTLAEASEPALTGEQQGLWWDRLEVEHANFRAALAWSRTEAHSKTGLRLMIALLEFWERRGHLTEGSGWLAGAVTGVPTEPPTEAFRALRAKAHEWLGKIGIWQGNLDAAQPQLEESIALFRELGDRMGLADALGKYGMLFVVRGDYMQAGPLLEESLVLSRELGNMGGTALCLLFLGNLAYSKGHSTQAGAFWEESLALFRAEDATWDIATLLASLAIIALDQSDYERASEYLLESLSRFREMGERWQAAHGLEVFARLTVEQWQPSEKTQRSLLRAARIFGAAGALRETLSAPMFSFQRYSYERGINSLRAKLDGAALAAAWAEGRAMTLEQIITHALEDRASPTEIALTSRAADQPLTDRELEILRLIADGLNSREVAQRLFLSVLTIRWYLKLIYGKLDVHSRSEAIARAKELKLLV